VKTLAQRVFAHIQREGLLKAGDRVGAAVSGGADSVALLRLLLELRGALGIVLSVVHFNHKLRGQDADEDELFVAEMAREHKIAVHCESADVAAFAAQKKMSREAAARELRYAYFWRLLRGGVLDRVATAHTQDDQAETVLLRVVRGAGTRGMAGIYPELREAGKSAGTKSQFLVPGSQFSAPGSQVSAQGREPAIVRPLLGIGKKELEGYLGNLGKSWREDKSNRDLRHSRNLMRHGILPRLERNFNPAVREALAETAEIARAEEDYWQSEVARVLPEVMSEDGEDGFALSLGQLAGLPLALQRWVIREAAESKGLRLEFRHVEEVRELGSSQIMLPNGWVALRNKDELRFRRGSAIPKADYDYRLSVPGRIEVQETGTAFEAVVIPEGRGEGYNAGHLFDALKLGRELQVRNWRAGDRFWPAYTKGAKKLKELLQEQRLAEEEKRLWPVVLNGDEIVWVRGFPVHARLRAGEHWKQAIVIRESPLGA
jgi:tRNA(Ile)-lysidine synthase